MNTYEIDNGEVEKRPAKVRLVKFQSSVVVEVNGWNVIVFCQDGCIRLSPCIGSNVPFATDKDGKAIITD
jgi:hypothetical protein